MRQLGLRFRAWGGKRKGAGRKPSGPRAGGTASLARGVRAYAPRARHGSSGRARLQLALAALLLRARTRARRGGGAIRRSSRPVRRARQSRPPARRGGLDGSARGGDERLLGARRARAQSRHAPQRPCHRGPLPRAPPPHADRDAPRDSLRPSKRRASRGQRRRTRSLRVTARRSTAPDAAHMAPSRWLASRGTELVLRFIHEVGRAGRRPACNSRGRVPTVVRRYAVRSIRRVRPAFLGYDPGEVRIDTTSDPNIVCLVYHFRGRTTCPYGQDKNGIPPSGAGPCCSRRRAHR